MNGMSLAEVLHDHASSLSEFVGDTGGRSLRTTLAPLKFREIDAHFNMNIFVTLK